MADTERRFEKLYTCDYSIVSEFRFDGVDYIEEKFVAATNSLAFGKIMPAEFKFFTVIK